MENSVTQKRGLVVILVVATVVIFVGLVWGIAKFLPLNILGDPRPSHTADVPVAGRNCTYPVGYWQEHPELYPSQMVIGGKVFRAQDIGGVFSHASQDTALQLQAQLSGVFLNFLAGADQSKIESTIFEAYGWLVRNPAGSELSESERQAGSKLTNILLAYNQGLTGVPACEPELTLTLAASGTATEAPTLQLTSTPSETSTPTPSETPSATNFPTAPITTLIPSRTPVPTTNTPVQPTTTPSQTLAPPTNTSVPSTDTPRPTSTWVTPTPAPSLTQLPTTAPTYTPTP